MKNYVIKIIMLIIISIILIGTPYSSFAANTLNTDIIGNTFYNTFNPNKSISPEAQVIVNPIIKIIQTIVNPILGILQIIGGIIMVLSIAFYGFQNILSADTGLSSDLGIHVTPQNKNKYLRAIRLLIIGSVILFMSTTIVKMVFEFFLG